MALKDEIQVGLIRAGVFFLFVHDESGVSVDPMADAFVKPVRSPNVDELDTNLLPVFLRQLVDPAAQKEIVFFHLLWVLVEVLLIPLFPQTHLVCK